MPITDSSTSSESPSINDLISIVNSSKFKLFDPDEIKESKQKIDAYLANNSNTKPESPASFNNTNNNNNNSQAVAQEQSPLNNFGNDYSYYYVKTGIFPQTHIQNSEVPLVGYPKLQLLHELKGPHTRHYACTPYTYHLITTTERVQIKDINNQKKSHHQQQQKISLSSLLSSWISSSMLTFDVVLIGGCYRPTSSPFLNFSQLSQLPIASLTPRPSILFIWVPGFELPTAKRLMDFWGFRRSEDIVYMTRSKLSPYYPPQHEDDYIEKSTWHCLMGIKGTLRRSEDTNLINCNVDTDVIVEKKALLDDYYKRNNSNNNNNNNNNNSNSKRKNNNSHEGGNNKEKSKNKSSSSSNPNDDNKKIMTFNIVPEEIYTLIENFSLMSRRVHILPNVPMSYLPKKAQVNTTKSTSSSSSFSSLSSNSTKQPPKVRQSAAALFADIDKIIEPPKLYNITIKPRPGWVILSSSLTDGSNVNNNNNPNQTSSSGLYEKVLDGDGNKNNNNKGVPPKDAKKSNPQQHSNNNNNNQLSNNGDINTDDNNETDTMFVNNFNPQDYLAEIRVLGTRVPVNHEIDNLRPKTPPRAKKGNNNNNNSSGSNNNNSSAHHHHHHHYNNNNNNR